MDRLLPVIIDALRGLLAPEAIVLRNDSPARTQEGLTLETRVAVGTIAGAVPVEENGVVFEADVLAGQKTGWFFDQRDNRAFIAGLAAGARVLDLYCYSGGFAVAAAHKGAAAVLGIDRSEPALALAAEAARRNGVAESCVFRRGEVFAEAAALATAGERFDIVIADPPPFARSKPRSRRRCAAIGSSPSSPPRRPRRPVFCFSRRAPTMSRPRSSPKRCATASPMPAASPASSGAPGRAPTIRSTRRCRRAPI